MEEPGGRFRVGGEPSRAEVAAGARPPGRGFAAALPFLLSLLAAACAGGDASGEGAGSVGASRYRGVPLEEPVARPDFTLTDTRGRPFAFREETGGKATLLFFGYTHCPDFCPVQMANLAAVLDDLSYEARSRIEVVFVSVDPERDSRERLRQWLDRFDRSFVGLRGSEEEVKRLQERLGLPPAVRQDREVEGRYTVGHASQVIAFAPDDTARFAYPFGTRQRDWAHDLPKLAEEGREGS